MYALRKSISKAQDQSTKNEEQDAQRRQKSISQSSDTKSFLDTLIIPRRTRYPSDKAPQPEQIDILIAEKLLQYDGSNTEPSGTENKNAGVVHKLRKRFGNQMEQDKPRKISDPFRDGKNFSRPMVESAYSTSAWSDVSSSRHCSSGSTGSQRTTDDFVEQYNILAKSYGLTALEGIAENASHNHYLTEIRPKLSAKRWLLSKIVPNHSSKNFKDAGTGRLRAKGSLLSLIGRRSNLALKSQPLQQLYHLGGTSILHLPSGYRAFSLAIPTALAATANYLVANGPGTPGIFRVPGQMSVVDALYEHYALRLQSAGKVPGLVQDHIGSTVLPKTIPCGIHDVAGAFKRFLRDVPGGILGSIELFKALQEIEAIHSSKSENARAMEFPNKANFIALAILSLQSCHRTALLSAVFGLLAFLKQDPEDIISVVPRTPPRLIGPESMSSKALGFCFAPLLLSDLTEMIQIDSQTATTPLSSPSETPKRHLLRHGKLQKVHEHDESTSDEAVRAGKARMNSAAAVIEMLLREWENIVKQLQIIGVSHKSEVSTISTNNLSVPPHDANRRDPLFQFLGLSLEEPAAKSNGTLAGSEHTSGSVTNGCPSQDLLMQPPQLRMKTGTISRSTSLGRIPVAGETLGAEHMVELPWSSPVFSQSTGAVNEKNDKIQARWPSLRPAATSQSVDATDGSSHGLPWWEERSPISFKAQARKKILSPNRHKAIFNIARSADDKHQTKSVKLDTSCKELSLSSSADSLRMPCTGSAASPKPREGQSQCDLEDANHDHVKEGAILPARSYSYSDDVSTRTPQPDITTLDYVVVEPSDFSRNVSIADLAASSDYSSVCSEYDIAQPKTQTLPKRGTVKTLAERIDFANSTRAPPKRSPTRIPEPILEVGRPRRVTSSSFSHRIHRVQPGSADLNGMSETGLMALANFENDPGFAHTCEQDNPSTAIRRRSQLPLPESPHRHRKVMAFRPMHSPFSDEPPMPHHIDYRRLPENRFRCENTEDCYADDRSLRQGSQRVNVGTLYAEITRLQSRLDSSYERNWQLEQQVNALRHYRDSGTLSDKLMEMEREARRWKSRAMSAEGSLRGRDWLERRKNGPR